MTSYFPPTRFYRDPSAWLHQWWWRGQRSADESKYGHRYPRLVPPAYCSSVPHRPTPLPRCVQPVHLYTMFTFDDWLTTTPLNLSMGIIIQIMFCHSVQFYCGLSLRAAVACQCLTLVLCVQVLLQSCLLAPCLQSTTAWVSRSLEALTHQQANTN